MHHWRIAWLVVQEHSSVYDIHETEWSVSRAKRVIRGDWKMDSFVEQTIAQLKEKIGDGKVLCALSGGVDSSVAAVLLAKAVGKQLT